MKRAYTLGSDRLCYAYVEVLLVVYKVTPTVNGSELKTHISISA
jgi:hypothetical protein